jgi:hybrid cluster-associated redox disulfide protein
MKTKKKRQETISAKMSFAEVMQQHPEAAEVFFRHGMSCFGCPAAMQETLEMGIKAHGQDVEKIVDELNKAVKKKK